MAFVMLVKTLMQLGEPSEYDNIKTYQQMENLYLRGGFNAGINKIKEKYTNKIIANRLFQSENE